MFPLLGAFFSHTLAGLVLSFHLGGCTLHKSSVREEGFCADLLLFFASPDSLSTFLYLLCLVPQEDDFYKLHLCSLAIWLLLELAQWGVGGGYEREAARLGCLFPWLFPVCSLCPSPHSSLWIFHWVSCLAKIISTLEPRLYSR